MRATLAAALLGSTIVTIPFAMRAQNVERMVASAGDGSVQFHFPARDGVCGNGRDFYRSSDIGGYYNNYSSGMSDDLCTRGPVRAVLIRAGREIVRIETYAGPLAQDPSAGKDLGAVSAHDAATYLLSLATTLDGRPAREALQPAMMADSATVTPQLLQLARDASRSRDIRSSAVSWLARRRNEPNGIGAPAVQHALDAIVRDHNESESLRRDALSTLGNLERGEGIPLLIAFAGDADSWISRQAVTSLANSGDPRARQFVREAVKRTDLNDETRATVIRGIGNQYAVPADYKVLRDLYANVNTDQERNAIINVLGTSGGSENINWLLALAASPTETASRRRQAVSVLSRNDDPRVKDALKGLIEKK